MLYLCNALFLNNFNNVMVPGLFEVGVAERTNALAWNFSYWGASRPLAYLGSNPSPDVL